MNGHHSQHKTRLSEKLLGGIGAVFLVMLAWVLAEVSAQNERMDNQDVALGILVKSSEKIEKFVETYGPKIIQNETRLNTHFQNHKENHR